MLATVTLVLALVVNSRTAAASVIKCDHNSSIPINNGIKSSDGSISHDGITYYINEYYYDNATNTPRGCICEKKLCVRKCCPVGSTLKYVTGSKKCIKDNVDFDPPVWDRYRIIEGAHVSDLFHLVPGKPTCKEPDVRVRATQAYEPIHIRNDGKLFIDIPTRNPPWALLGPDKYCIDTFIVEDATGQQNYKLDALVCFGEDQGEHNFVLNSSCMLISCVFILVTCAVYAWLPELRNLHGRVLMAYLLSLFVAFLFMSTMQILLSLDRTSTVLCSGLSFVIYFAFEAAFFWLNVMCFDIWWTFSGKRGLSLQRLSTRARFNAYAVYAFGCPTILTIFLAALEFSGLPPHPWLPLLRSQGCFLYANARLIYLYGPMTILCIINMVFFVLTAIKIVQIKKQTAVLKSKESSSTHDTQRTDKQRLLLYVKLFIVMGINWILEVLSAIYPDAKDVWMIIDAYNVLIGVIIFFIFVCKRKIFRLIKKRYKQLRGDPMSRTHTTSSRTMSTKEEYQMGSMKNNNK